MVRSARGAEGAHGFARGERRARGAPPVTGGARDARPVIGVRDGRTRAPRVAAACAVVLALGACDASPGPSGPTTPPPADPMDPQAVADAELSGIDTSWLCGTDDGAGAPGHSGEPGVLTPTAVTAEDDEVTIGGSFALDPGYEITALAPDALVTPAHPENRALPADAFAAEPGSSQYPQPEIVAVERAETTLAGAAPSEVTTRLRLGTCEGGALPDGPYLLDLSGGAVEAPSGGGPAGWSASQQVLIDVVDGQVRPVPGAVTAPGGEIPADTSRLHCGARLEPMGDGAGLSVSVSEQETTVPSSPSADEDAVGVDARVGVSASEPGTRALLEGVVVTLPDSRTVVAGARNAESIGLAWFTQDGVSTPTTAWTSQLTCGHGALNEGSYLGWGFALTVDADGATQLVLSDPWTLDVVAPR